MLLSDRVRRVQLGFALMLSVAMAQTVWWIFDLTSFTRQTESQMLQALERNRDAAQEMLGLGLQGVVVEELLPEIRVAEGRAEIREEAAAAIHERARRHANQYHWEGGFFLVVLAAGMAILWRALRQESELRRRQQNFLAAVSHELRSPIASLQLTTETLARRTLAEEKRRDLLRRSLEDLDRLSRLINDLVVSARLEEHHLKLDRSRVALVEVVDAVLDDLERGGHDTGRVALRIENALSLFADATGVATVVRNLVENALKATQGGGRVTVEGAVRGRWIELRVADDGVGFEPREASRLFEKFYRPGDEMRRSSRGTGLGLYLVRSLVELEGGEVEATSRGPGGGATFSVRWPLAKRVEGPGAGAAEPASEEAREPQQLELNP